MTATESVAVTVAPSGATSWDATTLLLGGLFLTGITLRGDTASAIARHAAIGVGVSLACWAAMEVQRSWQNLLRADLVSQVTLYYLLFAEFLVPQPAFDALGVTGAEASSAIRLVLWAFAAMAIGRHCVSGAVERWHVFDIELPASSLVSLFWICFGVGFFHMLMAVSFNPIEMVSWFFEPRFEAPWGRPQFGDWRALLFELGATIYLVPPIAGVILGRRKLHSPFGVWSIVAALLFTLLYGFSTGTRSIIGAYLITFLSAYFYSSSTTRREIIPLAALAGVIILASTFYGVEFRNVGLRTYLSEHRRTAGSFGAADPAPRQAFFVDYNLFTVAQLVKIFPRDTAYVGWKVPEWVFVRVVPRALWPGKPDGMDVSAETYLDIAPGTTVSSTFIGEGYMWAGTAGAMTIAFALGWLAMWWTRKAFSIRSDLGILFYGAGFFAVVATMRSVYMLPVALVPMIAIVAMAHALGHKAARG